MKLTYVHYYVNTMTESTDSCNIFYDESKSDESVVDHYILYHAIRY